MKKAFTIVELLVAVGLLTGLLAASGIIFKAAINAQRTANATAEITRKLRTITGQLTADFEHLLKNGEILVVWVPIEVDPSYLKDADKYSDDRDGYVRFDRIMFFANGNFHSYHQRSGDIRGNIARVCYMLARNGNGTRAHGQYGQYREDRILARSQHILTPEIFYEPDGVTPSTFPWPGSFTKLTNNWYEYDSTTLQEWLDIASPTKEDMWSVITDLRFAPSSIDDGGLIVDTEDPNSISMLLAEGVGEFKVQGWYEEKQRWYPEIDPDGNGDLTDSDFDLADLHDLLFPGMPIQGEDEFQWWGFGGALKFTFTLYDSRGIFPEGRTFTHIVYLDN